MGSLAGCVKQRLTHGVFDHWPPFRGLPQATCSAGGCWLQAPLRQRCGAEGVEDEQAMPVGLPIFRSTGTSPNGGVSQSLSRAARRWRNKTEARKQRPFSRWRQILGSPCVCVLALSAFLRSHMDGNGQERKTPGSRSLGVGRQLVCRLDSQKNEKLPR